MKKLLLFLLLSMLFVACTSSNALKLKATSSEMYPCAHPSNGFIKTGFSIRGTEYNPSDSFIFDFDNEKFVWKDHKGSSSNRMCKLSESGNVSTYATEYNAIRITMTTSDYYTVDIIFRDGNDSYMITYECTRD